MRDVTKILFQKHLLCGEEIMIRNDDQKVGKGEIADQGDWTGMFGFLAAGNKQATLITF